MIWRSDIGNPVSETLLDADLHRFGPESRAFSGEPTFESASIREIPHPPWIPAALYAEGGSSRGGGGSQALITVPRRPAVATEPTWVPNLAQSARITGPTSSGALSSPIDHKKRSATGISSSLNM